MVGQVKTGPQRFGDFAYFPGTGPPGAMCRDCVNYNGKRMDPAARCAMVAMLRHIPVLTVKPIRGSTAACRYYAARQRG